VAIKILSMFPDYGKAPPEYITSMIEVIAHYPVSFHSAFSDPRKGIPSRTKFLPTPFDFAEMAKELQKDLDHQNRLADMDRRFRATALAAPEGPYEPKPPIRYFDKQGNSISERVALENVARFEADKIKQAEVDRKIAYAKEIGDGDTANGFEIMIEREMEVVPENWTPSKPGWKGQIA
jgi:hypothetical protein